jgi:hypothetical protein
MNKLLYSLGLTLSLAFTLTGCELYFGDHHDGRGDERPPGWTCGSDADCASGCYCEFPADAGEGSSGTCVEQGFCESNADCPDGFICDDRSSCVPNPVQTCSADAECATGSYCDNGTCAPSCVCVTDEQAQAFGWQHCDEARLTCMPVGEGGTCGGAGTCGTEPTCAAGEIALVNLEGCFTGACGVIATCDVTPACGRFQYEADCLNPSDTLQCGASYTGINCRKQDGTACQSGDSGCTCDSFLFAECR